MSGRIVWITGASGGIGEALARAFAADGDRVVLSARRVDELERVRTDLPRSSEHLVLPLDMGQPNTFASAVEKVRGHFGRLDILVNNAGITQRSHVMETSMEVDRRIMEVDFFGVIGLTRAVLPWLKEQGAGQLVIISSLVGELPTPKRAAYSAAKHALHGWFESLRAEEHGWLKILMVLPGFVRTQVSVNALEGDGSRHGQMDDYQAAGMAPEVCARRILKAVQQGRASVIIAGREKVGIYIKRFLPGLYRYAIRRVKVT
jgi:short-subunit dehydrogenase